jgi:hypothetical protein
MRMAATMRIVSRARDCRFIYWPPGQFLGRFCERVEGPADSAVSAESVQKLQTLKNPSARGQLFGRASIHWRHRLRLILAH